MADLRQKVRTPLVYINKTMSMTVWFDLVTMTKEDVEPQTRAAPAQEHVTASVTVANGLVVHGT